MDKGMIIIFRVGVAGKGWYPIVIEGARKQLKMVLNDTVSFGGNCGTFTIMNKSFAHSHNSCLLYHSFL